VDRLSSHSHPAPERNSTDHPDALDQGCPDTHANALQQLHDSLVTA
jgi:hypothetical protein